MNLKGDRAFGTPMDEVLAAAGAVEWSRLGGRTLCDPCLGRLFGKAGHGLTNEARGRAVRGAAGLPPGPCWVCEGLTSELDDLASLVARRLEPWEYDTFVIGSKVDPSIAAREEALWKELALSTPEPIKAELNREIGKRVEAIARKSPDLRQPDVVAIVDPAFGHVDVQVNPLFLRGRYRKLSRDIPQTHWPCRACRGKGCGRCGGIGKMYATSVEEIIAAEVLKETGGRGFALHGMGREDIDARMLGRGRPFVLEVKEPKVRHADLGPAVARINASGLVEVDGFARARADDVVAVKQDRASKTYRLVVRMASPVEEGKLKRATSVWLDQPIAQRTPSRVAHRRADTIRHRRVLAVEVGSVDGDRAEVRVTAEAGTYVKELVHGDGGRTTPSLADSLGVACEVLELDVLDVHDGG
jgi:tRNA pseudouridine synthase 10